MADAADTQDQAKVRWISSYPFESPTGGLGVPLMEANTTSGSTRAALVGGEGSALCLTNDGTVTIYVAWGGSSVTASTACFPVLPGTQTLVSLPKDGSATHVACITRESTAYLSVQRGYGN